LIANYSKSDMKYLSISVYRAFRMRLLESFKLPVISCSHFLTVLGFKLCYTTCHQAKQIEALVHVCVQFWLMN